MNIVEVDLQGEYDLRSIGEMCAGFAGFRDLNP